MKYLVMERHESYVIVLDENGRFFKVANMDYAPGQTLTKIVPMEDIKAKRKRRWGFFALFIALVAVVGVSLWFFLFSGFFGAPQGGLVYRFQMGGEIAVTCDSENNVTKVEGIDEEGKAIAENFDFNNKNMNSLSCELLEKAYSLGYLHKDSEIFVAIEGEEDDDNKYLENVADSLENYAEEKYDIEVEKSSWEDYQKDAVKENYKEHDHDDD